MPNNNDKFQENIEISYENYFKTRFNGIIDVLRALAPLMDEKKALERIKKLYEKKSIEMIVRQLKNTKPITNFEEYKEIYKEQFNTEFMQHCTSFTIVEDTPTKLSFKFTKCLWAKTFLEKYASALGYVMCCHPDYAMTKAFHPNLKLVRTKTLMQGDECCDSTYVWEE